MLNQYYIITSQWHLREIKSRSKPQDCGAGELTRQLLIIISSLLEQPRLKWKAASCRRNTDNCIWPFFTALRAPHTRIRTCHSQQLAQPLYRKCASMLLWSLNSYHSELYGTRLKTHTGVLITTAIQNLTKMSKKQTLEKRQNLQQTVLGGLDIHMKKSEISPCLWPCTKTLKLLEENTYRKRFAG